MKKSTLDIIELALYKRFYDSSNESNSRDVLDAAVDALGSDNESVKEMVSDFRVEFDY